MTFPRGDSYFLFSNSVTLGTGFSPDVITLVVQLSSQAYAYSESVLHCTVLHTERTEKHSDRNTCNMADFMFVFMTQRS